MEKTEKVHSNVKIKLIHLNAGIFVFIIIENFFQHREIFCLGNSILIPISFFLVTIGRCIIKNNIINKVKILDKEIIHKASGMCMFIGSICALIFMYQNIFDHSNKIANTCIMIGLLLTSASGLVLVSNNGNTKFNKDAFDLGMFIVCISLCFL